ncbi:MAG: hypothetical protein ACTSSH_10280 [Candidatus Heimdallarchaeota archaeon]
MAFGEQPKNHLLIDTSLKKSINLIKIGFILIAVEFLILLLVQGINFHYYYIFFFGPFMDYLLFYAIISLVAMILRIALFISSFIMIIIGFVRYSRHYQGVYRAQIKKSLIFYICYASIFDFVGEILGQLSSIFYSYSTNAYLTYRVISIILVIASMVLFTLFFAEMNKSFNELNKLLGTQQNRMTSFYISLSATALFTIVLIISLIFSFLSLGNFASSVIFNIMFLIVWSLIGVSVILLIISFNSIDTFAIANMVQQPLIKQNNQEEIVNLQ